MRLLLLISLLFLISCQSEIPQTAYSDDEIRTESEHLNHYLDSVFDAMTARSPMAQSYLGIKDQQHRWDDISDEYAQETIELIKKNLFYLKENFDSASLDAQAKLSYKLFIRESEEKIESFKWRFHNYPVNTQEGLHTELPTLLANVHKIDNLDDARDYVSRLADVNRLFDQLITGMKVREEMKIIPPLFVYPKVITACRNLISGYPFNNSLNLSPIRADLTSKLNQTDSLSLEQKDSIIKAADIALVTSVKPAYQKLIAYLEQLEKKATHTVGAWSWPNGDEFYAHEIRRYTTTEMSPEEVYQLGLKEVARIQEEIKELMKQVKFEGDSVQDFFRYVTTDKRFFYPNTEAGRQAYLKANTGYIENMKQDLDKLFNTKPKATIEVRAVEKFRERSAGTAFYERPAPDGSRPGIFYANLHDMSESPIFQIEALAYHEGIPGHHMQIAIAQELQEIPKFRRFGGYTAYVEGWGLYSEKIPKEIGYYKDPYQDFGRLSMELLRAARLVVDPGIHYKKWTKEQAMEYFRNNTAEPSGEVVNAIERYITWPGQATAYKVGMNKILELREKAQRELAGKFSLREFHDVVLLSGALPLNILEENVNAWIAQKNMEG